LKALPIALSREELLGQLLTIVDIEHQRYKKKVSLIIPATGRLLWESLTVCAFDENGYVLLLGGGHKGNGVHQ